MRVLIADVNQENGNSMYINYYYSLAEMAELRFFGPGFSTTEELDKGILDYAKNQGPFDTVILTSTLLESSIQLFPPRVIYQCHRFGLSDYSVNQAIRYADKIIKEISNMNLIKIVLFTRDLINVSREWQDRLEALISQDFYIMSAGSELIPELEEQTGRIFGANLKINNGFKHLLDKYPERSISIPVTAVYGEYFWGPLENRDYDWVVPGNVDGCYYARQQVLHKLRTSEFRVYDNFIDRTMMYKVDNTRAERGKYARDIEKYIDTKLGKTSPYLRNGLKREEIARWRENYNVALRSAKAAFADGGDGHIIVRKFMEIPARGTLLVCENVEGLERLGFRSGENMVAVTVENILDIARELFKNQKEMQRIANNGRNLVLSRHTSKNRAADTLKAVSAIQKGCFSGSYWENGEFKIRYKGEVQ